jgi:hypothetical protein
VAGFSTSLSYVESGRLFHFTITCWEWRAFPPHCHMLRVAGFHLTVICWEWRAFLPHCDMLRVAGFSTSLSYVESGWLFHLTVICWDWRAFSAHCDMWEQWSFPPYCDMWDQRAFPPHCNMWDQRAFPPHCVVVGLAGHFSTKTSGMLVGTAIGFLLSPFLSMLHAGISEDQCFSVYCYPREIRFISDELSCSRADIGFLPLLVLCHTTNHSDCFRKLPFHFCSYTSNIHTKIVIYCTCVPLFLLLYDLSILKLRMQKD